MESSFFVMLLALLLLSSFVKTATVLSVFRYGAGLVGFELGVVTLAVAAAISFAALPQEVRDSGLVLRVLSGQEGDLAGMAKTLSPTMAEALDPQIVRGLFGADAEASPEVIRADLSKLVPAFVLSQLKAAIALGVMLLIPFVLLDLLIAHVLSLLGVQQLGVQVVSMPLKLLLFLAVDGWGLLGSKLLGGGT